MVEATVLNRCQLQHSVSCKGCSFSSHIVQVVFMDWMMELAGEG